MNIHWITDLHNPYLEQRHANLLQLLQGRTLSLKSIIRDDGLVETTGFLDPQRIDNNLQTQIQFRVNEIGYIPLVIRAQSDRPIDVTSTGEDWIVGLQSIIKGVTQEVLDHTIDRVHIQIDEDNQTVDFLPIGPSGQVYLERGLLHSFLERIEIRELMGYRLLTDDLLGWYVLSVEERDHAKMWHGLILGRIDRFSRLAVESIQQKTSKLRADGYVPFLWSKTHGQQSIADLLGEMAALWNFQVVDHYDNLFILWCDIDRWRVDEGLGGWVCRSLTNISFGRLPRVTLSGDWVQTMDYDIRTRVLLGYAAARALRDMARHRPYLTMPQVSPQAVSGIHVSEDLSITVELGTIEEIPKLIETMMRYLESARQWFAEELVGPLFNEKQDREVLLAKLQVHNAHWTPLIIPVEGKDFLVIDTTNRPAQPGTFSPLESQAPFGEFHEQWVMVRDLMKITQLDREQYTGLLGAQQPTPPQLTITEPYLNFQLVEGRLLGELVYEDGEHREFIDEDASRYDVEDLELFAHELQQNWQQGRLLNRWSQALLHHQGTVGKQPIASLVEWSSQ